MFRRVSKIYNFQIIAEVKTQSTFGFKSNQSWDALFDIANTVGDIISIHTDPRWGGSWEILREARRRTSKPILAKGIHAADADLEKALSLGADYVLVVGRIPGNTDPRIIIEPNDLAQLAMIPHDRKVVWNQRDLATGEPKRETFAAARKLFPGWLCQASLIEVFSDIDPSADAALVGTHLEKFARSLPAR